jgi:geranylgeranyl diphosphate synthase type II
MTTHLVQAYFTDQSENLNTFLRCAFANQPETQKLVESMRYSLLAGGKRLRPLLCMATARTFGVSEADVMPVAAAIELVHCYSLIHDDLPCMDDDDLRRGVPTNHKVYGEATALLAGDGLLTYAFELLSQPLTVPPTRQLRMVQTLARAAGPYGMVGGQQADMDAEHTEGSLQTLQFIHTNKTAKLIQAAVDMGALFADIPEAQRTAVSTYGLHIGLAFQMIDDWLDVVGSEEELGKKPGMDEQLMKLTYPRLVGIHETRELALSLCQKARDDLANAGIQAPLLVDLATFIVERNK